MATQSPFSWLEGLMQNLPFPKLQPPAWVTEELQRRIVLLLNHILMQEPEAMQRLLRQKGRVVHLQWRDFSMELLATPAGLLDRAPASAKADLVLAVSEDSPFALAQAALRGDRPAVRIEGDVQLAAEVNWLVDHVRWDLEEDLSRIVGDAPAHIMAQAGASMTAALRQFLGARSSAADDKARK
jgi:ubiquinone biosynthesis protein UbiJ